MKKRNFFVALLLAVLTAVSVFAFSACKNNEEPLMWISGSGGFVWL